MLALFLIGKEGKIVRILKVMLNEALYFRSFIVFLLFGKLVWLNGLTFSLTVRAGGSDYKGKNQQTFYKGSLHNRRKITVSLKSVQKYSYNLY
jgi:hypothetical protein